MSIAIITGGTRGIGAATAARLADQDFALVIGYQSNRVQAQATLRALKARGADAIAVPADMRSEADILQLFEACDREFGPATALINNAGIVAHKADVANYSKARIDNIFQVNVIGSILCAREAVRRMSTALGGNGGSIVNVSSVAARIGSPHEYVDYAASKGAIDSFTLGLAKEVADQGIRVNAVRPGIIATDIHASGGQPDRIERLAPQIPMGRAGLADEVAATIVWLVGEESSYTSGALLDVSGAR